MTLQASGAIDASDINVELGKSSTAAFSIGNTDCRDLAGVSSGPISFSDFYGKRVFEVNLTAGTAAGSYAGPLGSSSTVTTSSVGAQAFGGTPPYTYLWEYVSNDIFVINSPTSLSTNFSKSGTVVDSATATYKVTVTDDDGRQIVKTLIVTATWSSTT